MLDIRSVFNSCRLPLHIRYLLCTVPLGQLRPRLQMENTLVTIHLEWISRLQDVTSAKDVMLEKAERNEVPTEHTHVEE